MNTRLLLAGFVAGIAMFAWSAVAHIALPLGEAGISQIDNEQPFLDAMKIIVKDTPGFYIFPAMPKGMSEADYSKRLQVAPSGILVYNRAGAEMMTPKQFGT